MNDNDTRQARIEAGARAIHAEAERVRKKHLRLTMPFPPFDEMSAEDQDQLRSYVGIVLDVCAADAVAAPREVKTLEFPYTDADFADAAAARPTPDAETMEREVEAFKDALERFLMAWGNRFVEGGDAIAGERYNEVVALFRKAVSR